MAPREILYLLMGVLVFDFFLDKILDLLNLRHARKPLPGLLNDVYDPTEYTRSLNYQKTNTYFGFITSSFSLVLTLFVFGSGILGKADSSIGEYLSQPVLRALAFFGILFVASDILNIPFSLYHTFIIEERFGFNKTTLKTFFMDKLKGYILGFIIGGIILGILFFLIEKIGPNFWVWFWIFISLFIVLANMFYTTLIVPMFNKLIPLQEGDLRSAIEDYSRKEGFHLSNIFVLDNSKRSTKANAYFSGLGKRKKIVLFDTLIQNHSVEELVAILAHEMGHFKKKHIITGLFLSIFQTGIILFLSSRFIFSPNLSEALGQTQLSYELNLIAFGILFSPISEILGIFMNIFSRKNEYEADTFAAQTYAAQPLMTALKKLSEKNLSNLNPHPAYVFIHYSHPPLIKRLENLETKLTKLQKQVN